MSHRLLAGVFSALVVLAASTAAFAGTPSLEKPSLNLAVGTKTLVAYLPLTIAEQLGFFKKEGLDVQVSDFGGGAKALQALVGGSADVVCGAYEHTIFMQAKDVKIKVIALQDYSFGLVVGLRKDLAAKYQGPQDLKGLKIGVTAPGSASAVGLSLLLAKANLTLSDVAVIGVGGGARAATAMTSGQLDGMANFDPVISTLERDGAMTDIIDTRKQGDLNKLYSGPYAASAFYMSSAFIEKNPKTTQAFVDAINAALTWLAGATTDQIVAAVPQDYYGDDRDLYRTVVEKNRGQFSKDGRVSMAMAENVLRIIAMSDDGVKNAKIDLTQTFDNSFLEKAQMAGQ
jgi:NitT/TauT family transport system substrate-binding protein